MKSERMLLSCSFGLYSELPGLPGNAFWTAFPPCSLHGLVQRPQNA